MNTTQPFSALLVLCLLCFTPGAAHAFSPSLSYEYAPGQHINYRVIGEGKKKILMLHGLGASSHTWDTLLQHWQPPSGYQLILLDLIGFGFSSKHAQADHSVLANARVINRFIRDHQIDDYVLVGHSFGGGVALMATFERLQENTVLPKALLLINAAAYESEFPLFVATLRTPLLNQLVLALLSPEQLASFTLKRLFHDHAKITAQVIERYAFFMAMPGHDQTLIQTAQQVVPENLDAYLPSYARFKLPALVIWGEQDQTIPLIYGERLAEELPQARLAVISDCGHLPQTECPQQTARHIEAFLMGLPK